MTKGKPKALNTKAIKVVKRKYAAENAQAFVNTAKVERNIRREAEGVINRWVDERRERSRTEKNFSDGRIRAWKND